METFGLISTICLGLCSFPLLWKTIKDGHCKGISGLFILMWWVGDITGSFYVIPLGKLPLTANYLFNTFMATTMLFYKIRDLHLTRKEKRDKIIME